MWRTSAQSYRNLIQDADWDSQFLREHGLIPNILDLIGNSDDAVLLDAGTATGWLFDAIEPRQAFACDIVAPEKIPSGVKFEIQDVQSLTYPNDTFDIIVASLLLLYCEDLPAVCEGFYRIAKPNGGRLIVSLMNPYFYRTGHVTKHGNFIITEDLSRHHKFSFRIGEQVGPFTYHFRPLPDYVNTLVAAGWRIKQMRDWYINMNEYREAAAEGAKSKIERSDKVPLFTFIECETP